MTTSTWPCCIEAHVVHIDGPLRIPMDRDVRHDVRTLLSRGERLIVLDLTRVSRIDAAGIGELVRAYNMARAVNGTIQVINPNRWVRHLIERVGLADVLLTDRLATV
jgi:anti-anti-sigma factor